MKNFSGPVKKSSTVLTNDPNNPQLKLVLHGTVKSLIEVRPGNVVSFRGMADVMNQQTIDMVSTSQPFHISKIESTLGDNITHQLETVSEGKHYRLKISNQIKHGSYSGFIKCLTDHPRKPDIVIRVIGSVEGEIAVKPPTVLIGRLAVQQPIRTQTVRIINNRNNPFQITRLSYDQKLLHVSLQPLPRDQGYSLEISPVLENIPRGARQQTSVGIETDVPSAGEQQVNVLLVNTQEAGASSVLLAPKEESEGSHAPGAEKPEVVKP